MEVELHQLGRVGNKTQAVDREMEHQLGRVGNKTQAVDREMEVEVRQCGMVEGAVEVFILLLLLRDDIYIYVCAS